jgi:O-antigen/teichoic acid export membrane protein
MDVFGGIGMIWATGLAAAAIVLVSFQASGHAGSNREKHCSKRVREVSRFAAWFAIAASFGILIGQQDSLLSGFVTGMLVLVAGAAEFFLASPST